MVFQEAILHFHVSLRECTSSVAMLSGHAMPNPNWLRPGGPRAGPPLSLPPDHEGVRGEEVKTKLMGFGSLQRPPFLFGWVG